ncbi:trypsin-like serine protease [Sneathiella marina]|uniref:Trypsin-like serine protease n=1 Tax=Sneathiella marina TaxID=2950108 RepID=A0ABY4WAL1_9PROT|nr:trypsin-like serine protease [Sneathiella marina]USG62314.1 trypsin-like serine protease [Sneathiella marina]
MHRLIHWISLSVFCVAASIATSLTMANEQHQPTEPKLVLPGIKGADDRVRVDISRYPWRSVGRLNRSGNFCTGVLVGPAQVITAAHCFWDNRLRKWASPENIHFVAGYERGNYLAHSKVEKFVLSGNRTPGKNHGKPEILEDWAIATLKEPLGEKFGYIPVSKMDDPAIDITFVQAGYSKDIPHMLTVHDGCRIAGIEKESDTIATILLHECDATNGDSGSPIFMKNGSEFSLVGLHVATYKPGNRDVLGIAISSDQFRSSIHAYLP